MLCDGPIDGWLNLLINTIRQTLADQLSETLRNEIIERPSGGPNQQSAGTADHGAYRRPATSCGRIEHYFTHENITEVVLNKY